GCFIFHTPINIGVMESHREAQNQRVFRTLHLLAAKQKPDILNDIFSDCMVSRKPRGIRQQAGPMGLIEFQ
ncbi:hypothetical protein NKW50_14865, partial [Acetobacter lambici]